MTENESTPAVNGKLAAALETVEQLPIEQRAEGYGQIYEDVRSQLERGDGSESIASI